jgi:predicted RNase H-like HicB family nuclease
MTTANHKTTYTLLRTKQGTFKVRFEWDARGRAYLVTVPSLPGAITFGTSLQEAKKMARDVIELHCECLVDEGHLVIDDTKRLVNPKGTIVKSLLSTVAFA